MHIPDLSDIEKRSLAAYFKSKSPEKVSDIETIEFKTLVYVVLSNHKGTIAVYRHLEERDMLKKLKRYPKDIQ